MTSRPVVYVETSALAARLIDQPESTALLDWPYDPRIGEAAPAAGLDVIVPELG